MFDSGSSAPWRIISCARLGGVSGWFLKAENRKVILFILLKVSTYILAGAFVPGWHHMRGQPVVLFWMKFVWTADKE